jgi:NADPH-dependent glutamate synthase beta subunit-like oxidoreductase
MYSPNLGELQSVLVGAARCLDCRDPRCINLCPEHVDVRAAMRLIIGRGPAAKTSTWVQESDQAAKSARDAIQSSFEWI